MKGFNSLLPLLCVVLCVVCVVCVEGVRKSGADAPAQDFPLFDYVNKPDDHYSYFDTGYRYNEAEWTGYLLNMTSQQWLTPQDSDRSIWTHQLVIIVPKKLVYTNVSALYITGNGNDNPSPPSSTDEDLLIPALLATKTNSICATLFQVPNQPILFAADPKQQQRSEDALVAFTWAMYMQNQDRPEWVDLLPMVKSAVRALDTIQDYVNKSGWGDIQHFAVAGASKRGWTTWLTGAADPRVIGIMPIVMDMLNFEENVLHMYQAYGGWTFAFEDYYAENITSYFGTPGLTALANIIDPLVYVDYLTMPKLVIDATGDEFFMPDDDYYWWGQLKGETYRLMVANAEHSMATGVLELFVGADAFYQSVIDQSPRPQVTWQLDPITGVITAQTNTKPDRVNIQFATTFDGVRRDFRLIKGDTPADPCHFIKVHVFGDACVNPVLWFSESVAPISTFNGTYIYQVDQPMPSVGWRGFLLEFWFPGPIPETYYRFTTQTSIIPNTFPFQPCQNSPQGCYGVLV